MQNPKWAEPAEGPLHGLTEATGAGLLQLKTMLVSKIYELLLFKVLKITELNQFASITHSTVVGCRISHVALEVSLEKQCRDERNLQD